MRSPGCWDLVVTRDDVKALPLPDFRSRYVRHRKERGCFLRRCRIRPRSPFWQLRGSCARVPAASGARCPRVAGQRSRRLAEKRGTPSLQRSCRATMHLTQKGRASQNESHVEYKIYANRKGEDLLLCAMVRPVQTVVVSTSPTMGLVFRNPVFHFAAKLGCPCDERMLLARETPSLSLRLRPEQGRRTSRETRGEA
jgi:hypothetical protein